MIYYPLSILIDAGIDDILFITTPIDSQSFKNLLGDGSHLGMRFQFAIQPEPNGIAQAFIIGEEFLNNEKCALILGDNIFHGAGLGKQINTAFHLKTGAGIFTYKVSNPHEYGVVTVNKLEQPISIVEKPKNPKSNLAITGLYFFDKNAPRIAKKLKPSRRGELEITHLIDHYRTAGELSVNQLPSGTAWLDSGTHNSLHEASIYIKVIEDRTGKKIGCIEESAWRRGKITNSELIALSKNYQNSNYGLYLKNLAEGYEKTD
jgi:glucose-1-phosphate thymidylyltransferase